jgi:hypothetical protein
MRLKPTTAYFLAFTALFAALAGFVFWGTWSISVCPVMPDARMTFPAEGTAAEFVRGWLANGKFVPWDVTAFLGSPYLWQELQYALAVYCAGLGLAYFLRGRGLSPLASYGAGLFLGFCGYWLTLYSAGHAGWFRWMLFGVFAFGLADRAVRKNKMKNWVLLGACVAWGSFYQPDLWFIFTVFTAAYVVWCCVRERKAPAWRGILVSALVFAAIGAPSFKSAAADKVGRERQIEEAKGTPLTGGRQADARDARWIFVTNWSLPPAETAEFIIPRLNGDTSCQMVLGLGPRLKTGVRPYTGALGRPIHAREGNYRQHSLYVGWVTCLLALAALVCLAGGRRTAGGGCPARHRGEIAFFACAALLFCLLSMGRYCEPLYRIVFALPVGDSLRAPVKWHHLTEFCLCVLAGYGLACVRRRCAALASARTVDLALGALVLFGACDLARCARLYCAPVDLSIVQAANPAADLVVRRGGGRVADLLEGARGIVAWSFAARGVKMTADPAATDVRFVWAPVQALSDPKLRAWLDGRRAAVAGAFDVTEKAIRSCDARTANVVLLEIPGVPGVPVKKPAWPPVTVTTWLGALSLLATAGVAVYGVKKS